MSMITRIASFFGLNTNAVPKESFLPWAQSLEVNTVWTFTLAELRAATTSDLKAAAIGHVLYLLDGADTTTADDGDTCVVTTDGKRFKKQFFASPVSSGDPATKSYVDTLVANIGKRQRVRAATTANITIATALNNGDTLDGVSLVTGDLVLVKDQSSAQENGIYVVGASPVRASEFDTYNEHPGSLVAVEEGTTNADTLWLCTSNDGGTLNTTAIAFSRIRIDIAIPVTIAQGGTGATDAATAAANLAVAKLAGNQSLTGAAGFDVTTPVDDGTKSTGTFTPTFLGGNWRKYTNGGAHTLAPPTSNGGMTIIVTNNGSAGAITTSGFTKKTGDSFDTTNAHKFLCFITVLDGSSHLHVQALF